VILVRPAAFLLILAIHTGCKSKHDEAVLRPASESPKATVSQVTGVAAKNAIVTLLPAGDPLPMPDQPAVMDQYAKQFVPNVLIVRPGQPVEFRNSEDMPHNVSVTRRDSGAEVFTVGTEPHQKHVHTFERAGQFDVKCDIHEGMEATLIVAPGPQTVIAGDDGQFAFANVPVGAYKLSLTFEGRTVESPLDVRYAHTFAKLVR
jgi:plastocyanin